jgi:plasmid stabilization system protein ParE
MAYKVVWTEEAEEDLDDILDYFKQFAPSKVMENFIDLFFEKLDLLIEMPFLGVHTEKGLGARRLLITKNKALYYQVKNETIILLHVFDTRQNPLKNP